MTIALWALLGVTVFLFGYLMYAMVRAERF